MESAFVRLKKIMSFPSLSLLYVAGILKIQDVKYFLDIHAENLGLNQTVQRLKDFGPDWLIYTNDISFLSIT